MKMPYVKNLNTGKIEMSDFFTQDEEKFERFKLNIERGILNYACEFCGSIVKVRSGSSVKEKVDGEGKVIRKGHVREAHWFHYGRDDEKKELCPYYTDSNGTEGKYSPETETHFNTKLALASCLEFTPGVSDVQVEKYVIGIVDNRRRKPDVQCVYNGRRLSFEVQHSYLRPQDLVERTDFFRNEDIVNFWVFTAASPGDLDSFQKDIFYDNLKNFHVFNESCIEKSHNAGQLVLTTFFKKKVFSEKLIYDQWHEHDCFLSDYQINDTLIPFFYNPIIENKIVDLKIKIMDKENEIEKLSKLLAEKQNELDSLKQKDNELSKAFNEAYSDYEITKQLHRDLQDSHSEVKQSIEYLKELDRNVIKSAKGYEVYSWRDVKDNWYNLFVGMKIISPLVGVTPTAFHYHHASLWFEDKRNYAKPAFKKAMLENKKNLIDKEARKIQEREYVFNAVFKD